MNHTKQEVKQHRAVWQVKKKHPGRTHYFRPQSRTLNIISNMEDSGFCNADTDPSLPLLARRGRQCISPNDSNTTIILHLALLQVTTIKYVARFCEFHKMAFICVLCTLNDSFPRKLFKTVFPSVTAPANQVTWPILAYKWWSAGEPTVTVERRGEERGRDCLHSQSRSFFLRTKAFVY